MNEEGSLKLVLRLMQALAVLRRKLALDFRLPHPRLNRTHCRALLLLHFEHGCTLTRSSELLSLEKGSTSSVVRFLIRHRYVRRDPDPADRRRAVLVLTPRGEKAFQRLKDRLARHAACSLERLPLQDVRALEKAVGTLARIGKRL